MAEVPRERIFISYARKDATPLALRLQAALQSRRYEVWLDKARLSGGTSWTIEIETAIEREATPRTPTICGGDLLDPSADSERLICRQTRQLRKTG